MHWLVLAAAAMLAEADGSAAPSPTDNWLAYQARVSRPLPDSDGGPLQPAPDAPPGIETPQPFGLVTPRIEPFSEERPPTIGEPLSFLPEDEENLPEDEEGAEDERGVSLNGLVGLEECGISLFGTQLIDWSGVISGGAAPGQWADRNYFDLGLEIDTERFLSGHWTGGTFFFLFQNVRGSDGSLIAGDSLIFDNIDLPESRGQLAEAFYEQILFEGRLRVLLGKIDANAEFCFSDYSGDFLNSGFGNHPTTFDVMPTYPDPATAINVFYYPTENLSLSFGVFDGSLVEGVKTGQRGLRFGGPYWLVSEVNVSYTLGSRHEGRITVGGWRHTYDAFERFDGLGTQDGQSGFYTYLDQTLWLERPCDDENEQGIRAFVSYGASDEDLNTFPNAITSGLVWNGMLPRRDDDSAGLGIVWGRFSPENTDVDEDAETVLDTFYRFTVTPNLSIQPMLHYIVNPGGDSTLDNAFITSIRLIAEF